MKTPALVKPTAPAPLKPTATASAPIYLGPAYGRWLLGCILCKPDLSIDERREVTDALHRLTLH